ncbi:hypothetical protein BDW72DRAFT_61508 [Aspergillus terricola var. indicus]
MLEDNGSVGCAGVYLCLKVQRRSPIVGKAALDPDKLVDHFSFRGAKRGQALAKELQHSSILHLHRQPTSVARFNLYRRKKPKMAEMDINCRWRCMAGHGRPAHPSLTTVHSTILLPCKRSTSSKHRPMMDLSQISTRLTTDESRCLSAAAQSSLRKTHPSHG